MTRKRDTDDETATLAENDGEDIAGENDPALAIAEHPTSSDVGKQTLTKADLGYDPAAPQDAPDVPEGMATPRHPDDPSNDPENRKVNDPN